jgi:hypothetical protein
VTNPFSKTTLWVVIGVAIVSLTVTVVLTIVGGDPEHATAGPNGYSRSAIGHRALIELLEKLDVPVVVSRDASPLKAAHGLLVLAEPQLGDDKTDRLGQLISSAQGNVLLVLPKWHGYAQAGEPWIDTAELEATDDVEKVAAAAGLETAKIERPFGAVRWRASEELVVPIVDKPQTIATSLVEGVVDDRIDHVLLGRFDHAGKTVWVLADPDVFSNFGLRHPENAQLAIRLIDRLRGDGPVVFDETVHGYAEAPSLLRVLFSFPIVLATIQVLICGLLAVWAAMVRFGPRRAAPPPLSPGKDFLIANTAALLRYGGHHVDALRSYFTASVADVKRALNAPANLNGGALSAWLERIRAVRAGTISLPDLEHDVMSGSPAPQRVVELADRIYRWRMEMMHGSRNRS